MDFIIGIPTDGFVIAIHPDDHWTAGVDGSSYIVNQTFAPVNCPSRQTGAFQNLTQRIGILINDLQTTWVGTVGQPVKENVI